MDSFISRNNIILSEYNAFTDGSKIDELVGARFLLRRGKKVIKEDNFKLPDTVHMVFQAEVFAIKGMVKYLLENAGCKFLKIFIDS